MTFHSKVLVVEDDEFTRFMMREIIAGLGVEVDVASDGEEGFEKLSEAPGDFGLVLMDLHMPRVSGIEAARSIRTGESDLPKAVPIIAVTADITYHDNARVAQLGMDGFASKPVSPGTLMSLIKQYCAAA
ncbi:MAG: response regulator [Pseudomonadota bacterium]